MDPPTSAPGPAHSRGPVAGRQESRNRARTEKAGDHTALGPGESPRLQGASPPRQRLRVQLGFKVLHFALVGEDEEGTVVAGVRELHQRAAQLLIPEVRGFQAKGHHGHLHRLVLAHVELCLLSVFGVKAGLPLGWRRGDRSRVCECKS